MFIWTKFRQQVVYTLANSQFCGSKNKLFNVTSKERMKDNKLKLRETRVVTAITAFETVSFGLSYLMFITQQQPETQYSVTVRQFSPSFLFPTFLSVHVNKISQKQENIIFTLQIRCQANNCMYEVPPLFM